MSNATMKDVLAMQREVQRRVADGSWTIDVEELKQPKGLTSEPAAEPLYIRKIEF